MKSHCFLFVITFQFTILITVGCIAIPAPTQIEEIDTSNMLVLTLELDKESYRPGDPIVSKLILRNKGTLPVLVNSRLALNSSGAPEVLREIDLVVIDPLGERLDLNSRIVIFRPYEDDFRELLPDESVEQPYELQIMYQIREPGVYSIEAIYENQSDPGNGAVAWKGQIRSNMVSFTLEP